MTYRTLLVAVDGTAESDARVDLALDLAVGMDAHLIGACGMALILPPLDDGYTGGAMTGEAFTLFRDIAEAEVRGALTRFNERIGARQDRTEWRGGIGRPADVLTQAATAADLVIVGRRSSHASDRAVDPADIVMAVGRPVLVVPPCPEREPVGRPAVIAWKTTREAQRAITAALPILRRASEVHVFAGCTAGDEDAVSEQLADVVAWLGRQDIPAEAHVQIGATAGITDDILSFAAVRGAGVIVAGAYGHSRLREWVLGGVTRDLLTSSPVCVLLSH